MSRLRAMLGPGRSLRATLFVRVVALIFFAISVVGALAFWSARNQIDRSYDAALITGANLLYALSEEELHEDPAATTAPLEVNEELLSAEDRAAFEAYAQQRMFRVWHRSQLVLTSDTGPEMLSPTAATAGFRNITQAGKAWRIYRLPVRASDVVIDVGEEVDARGELVRSISLDLWFPLLLLIPCVIALLWLSIGDGLRALGTLSSELQRRSLQELSPIDVRRWPAELVPLTRSTNHLFLRLARALHQERRVIDQAAHQLRTPLATIKLQTQLVAREQDETRRRQLIRDLEVSVTRAADLGDKLLTLARLECESEATGTCDLGAEIVVVLAELAVFAQAHGVVLAYQGQAATVRGDGALARLIVSNLVDNAIRHAPDGSEVEVTVFSDAKQVGFAVTDAGPGIPQPERAQVFERFYRGPNEAPGGSGLGLSIVAEAVRVLGGEVLLEDRADGMTGLRVVVSFPIVN